MNDNIRGATRFMVGMILIFGSVAELYLTSHSILTNVTLLCMTLVGIYLVCWGNKAIKSSVID